MEQVQIDYSDARPSKRSRLAGSCDTQGRARLAHHDYTIGWVCALPIELAASKVMLDDTHQPLHNQPHDSNVYTLGTINGHNVVMTCLPSDGYGTTNAAVVAVNMRRSFPCIRAQLVVGIGGGVPGQGDVRLGDVVVGHYVVQHDLGKVTSNDDFEHKSSPCRPPPGLLGAISELRARHSTQPSAMTSTIQRLEHDPAMVAFTNVNNRLQDVLFADDYDHVPFMDSCSECDLSRSVQHRPRSTKGPKIHYGTIASGNQVVKDANKRNHLVRMVNESFPRLPPVLCLEMEAAGLSANIPHLVIRGICDYADSHKCKQWQPYSAMTAAAYTKELLCAFPWLEDQRDPDNDQNQSSLGSSSSLSDEKVRDLMDSLRFAQIDARRATIKNAHTQTCRWIMERKEYRDWIDPSKHGENCGLFWIKGNPGTGKSTLMKFILNDAQKSMRNKTIISFFFNARGESLEKSTPGMYQSLLVQLLEQLSPLQKIVFEKATWDGTPPRNWTIEVLEGLFEKAVLNLDEVQAEVLCLVDALDECSEDQAREMVAFLERLGAQCTSRNLKFHFCLASRHYPHISATSGLEIILENQADHEQDIVHYVATELKISDRTSADSIRGDLRKKSHGIFLWVVLVVQILNREHDRGAPPSILRRKLHEIPENLHALFRDILFRDDKGRDQMLLCLRWLLFSTRPLRPEELYCAVKTELFSATGGMFDYNPEEISENMIARFILFSSKGLAEVTGTITRQVEFIHESVKDFLLAKDGLSSVFPEVGNDFEALSYGCLTQVCSSIVMLDPCHLGLPSNFPQAHSYQDSSLCESLTKVHPLLEYATRSVFKHADAARRHGYPTTHLSQRLLRSNWLFLHNLFEDQVYRHYRDDVTLLYILAEQDLSNLMRDHEEIHQYLKIESSWYGCPLFAALASGSVHAVETLFSMLDANHTPPEGKKVLTEAHGHHYFGPKFQFLHESSTILACIAERGNERILRLALTTNTFNMDEIDGEGYTALARAVSRGNLDLAVVRLLLDNGAGIGVGRRRDRLPLLCAARCGHPAAIQALLDMGANIEIRGASRTPALHFAVRGGHEGAVRALLRNGARIEATDIRSRTALLYVKHCSPTARVRMTRLLIDSDADIEARDENSETLLIIAAALGQVAVVQLLLDRSANIEARNDLGRTALIEAVACGASRYRSGKDIVKMLLARGANFRARDYSGLTALNHADMQRHYDCSELLRGLE